MNHLLLYSKINSAKKFKKIAILKGFNRNSQIKFFAFARVFFSKNKSKIVFFVFVTFNHTIIHFDAPKFVFNLAAVKQKRDFIFTYFV